MTRQQKWHISGPILGHTGDADVGQNASTLAANMRTREA
jgi:hypothetical protein